ncbi:hypothetical protein [Ruegeria sp.]|uniref:hypothetical protein n=1 Tax=Ruegeria sp. TaxID=1879320 RepID=UPI003B5ABC04
MSLDHAPFWSAVNEREADKLLSELAEAPKYDKVVATLFAVMQAGYGNTAMPDEVRFDLDDVRAVMGALKDRGNIDKVVKNVADVKYTYDARKDHPASILRSGHWVWLQNGKGKYIFKRTHRPNLIDLEHEFPEETEIHHVPDGLPESISALLGIDEQAVLARVRNGGLIERFLNLSGRAHALQGHHRTTVKYGQIEIDEVYGYEPRRGEVGIVPISAKGGNDKLSWSQALNLNVYGYEKYRHRKADIRSLGILHDATSLWIAEFSNDTSIDSIQLTRAKRYSFFH